MKVCAKCSAALCRQNKTGLCRSCSIIARNQNPEQIARQIAGRTMTPARLRALARIAENNKKPLRERFDRAEKQSTSAGCIEWLGGHDRNGYGRINIDGKQSAATHAALILDGRPRPSPRHDACHTCDNPPCVNPDHLWWGTRSENIQDCIAKGRFYLDGLKKRWAA